MSKNTNAAAVGRGKSIQPDNSGGAANAAEEPLRKKKGRKAPIIIGVLVLLLLLGVGITFGAIWAVNRINYVRTDDAAVDCDHVEVSAKMLGRIKSVLVKEGDEVEPGELLLLLDDLDLRAQETQAASSLNYAREHLALAQVNLDKARADFKRVDTLFKGGAATSEQHDHAASAMKTATVQYAIAKAQVDTANAQLGVIQTQLLNTRITAPISGTVSKNPLLPGTLIQPGQSILAINDLKHVWITANFEETKIERIKTGASVDITVDAYSSYPFRGRVSQIAAAIVPPPFSIGEFTKTTQRVPIKIEFTNLPDDLSLLPGMSAEVKVEAQPKRFPRLLRLFRRRADAAHTGIRRNGG
jgi:membrane fusion protein (multidrug efflux system)